MSLLSVNNMLIFFMYGINLQLFNSKLRISIFDNLPKSYILRKTCSFVQKKLRKTKIRLIRKFHKNISGFAFHAKIAQNFAKKICAKIAQILCKRFSHFVETLGGFGT